tara:strand:+ start:844 stop:1569 length:726 start_codon:yes stop_codon:yes gene_type:complete
LIRLGGDPDAGKQVGLQLPRIGFEITSINYAPERKLPKVVKNVKVSSSDGDVLQSQFAPVPWDINISLSIMAKNADDGMQIIEQIVPFFTPDYTISVNTIPSLGIKADIPVTLQGAILEDAYEGDFETRRALIWGLDFIMKTYIYGPITTTGVIKKAQVDLLIPANNSLLITANDISNTARSERVTVIPARYANGSPSTNSLNTVASSEINANSVYGFATDLVFYTDGKKFDPKTGTDILT